MKKLVLNAAAALMIMAVSLAGCSGSSGAKGGDGGAESANEQTVDSEQEAAGSVEEEVSSVESVSAETGETVQEAAAGGEEEVSSTESTSAQVGEAEQETAAGTEEEAAVAESTSAQAADTEHNVVKDSAKVEAVFVGVNKQPNGEEGSDKELLDTIWIYYDDMTFEQFAAVEKEMELFSTGTYAFEDGGDFVYAEEDEDHGDIVINRTKKYEFGKGLVDYVSSHTFDLNTLGFSEVHSNEKDNIEVSSIFSGEEGQTFVDEEGIEQALDTVWLYFDDGTFNQFANIDGETVLFSEGTYELLEEADFVLEEAEEKFGEVALNLTKKYQAGAGLTDVEESQIVDLGEWGLNQLSTILQ